MTPDIEGRKPPVATPTSSSSSFVRDSLRVTNILRGHQQKMHNPTLAPPAKIRPREPAELQPTRMKTPVVTAQLTYCAIRSHLSQDTCSFRCNCTDEASRFGNFLSHSHFQNSTPDKLEHFDFPDNVSLLLTLLISSIPASALVGCSYQIQALLLI